MAQNYVKNFLILQDGEIMLTYAINQEYNTIYFLIDFWSVFCAAFKQMFHFLITMHCFS